ncbi:hypothetical protein FHR37_006181 [Actinopolymorpha cephalotaxi]|uniref:Uncharacterized protein n=1 Tax=Actinopolymorpha cephalotaxi TaxID=504797 RepID=A0ABX2SFK7_9ACTN|nr:hypothetical protein [Actinopolymorpha cephalotaxi]
MTMPSTAWSSGASSNTTLAALPPSSRVTFFGVPATERAIAFYPFAETVASGAGPDEVVEQIDIGGPAMTRAAAKNHASVAVVTSPQRYADVLAAVAAGGFTLDQRQRLAVEAFVHTATYDVPAGRTGKGRRHERLAGAATAGLHRPADHRSAAANASG